MGAGVGKGVETGKLGGVKVGVGGEKEGRGPVGGKNVGVGPDPPEGVSTGRGAMVGVKPEGGLGEGLGGVGWPVHLSLLAII